jgi:hypothetical protein
MVELTVTSAVPAETEIAAASAEFCSDTSLIAWKPRTAMTVETDATRGWSSSFAGTAF